MSVAADADLESARKFAASYDFPTLVDAENALAKILGYRVIPNGYAFALDGVLLDEVVSGFDLLRDKDTTRDIVRSWLGLGPKPERHAPRPGLATSVHEALALFARGDALMKRGERREALATWHAAYLADPESFVVRKQIWRALYPERFGDPIDTEWQREQIRCERELGFGAANPTLPPPPGALTCDVTSA
ncbi:MAG: hypothetical protein KGN00_03625 [Chloroflexota bacterium]|nr:hypothetical protein [Chloroflexota bacterium]